MKNKVVFGVIAGFAAGAAAAIAGKLAVDKVVGEIKNELTEQSFVSPDGNNHVTLSYGFSETAKGLTYIKIEASAEGKKDVCKLIVFAKKHEDLFEGEWVDNDKFALLIGGGKRKQCCDVSFNGEQIVARYYMTKVSSERQ